MLSVNNNNYSPSFGSLEVKSNKRTLDALGNCYNNTLRYIIAAQAAMEDTIYLNGIIKKVKGRLVYRVRFAEGFEFPGNKGERTIIKAGRHCPEECAIYQSSDGDTVSLQKLKEVGIKKYNWVNFLTLKKKYSMHGITEYQIINPFLSGSEGFIYSDALGDRNLFPPFNRVVYWTSHLLLLDKIIEGIVNGEIKLNETTEKKFKPVPTIPLRKQFLIRKIMGH